MSNPFHDPKTGEFSSNGAGGSAGVPLHQKDQARGLTPGSGSGGTAGHSPARQDISRAALQTKLEGKSHAELHRAETNPKTDPGVRKMIAKELDDRASRGTMKGFGER